MFSVTREIPFCYGHRLLHYDGKCRHLHGHNGKAVITLAGPRLDDLGMVMDFSRLKRVVGGWIDETLDHTLLLHKDDPVLPLSTSSRRTGPRSGCQSHGGEHRPADLRLRCRAGVSRGRGEVVGDGVVLRGVFQRAVAARSEYGNGRRFSFQAGAGGMASMKGVRAKHFLVQERCDAALNLLFIYDIPFLAARPFSRLTNDQVTPISFSADFETAQPCQGLT